MGIVRPPNYISRAKKLDTALIIRLTQGFPLPGDPHKENEPMKRAIRVLILMVGLFCTYTAITLPTMAVAEDGAPPPYHPPGVK